MAAGWQLSTSDIVNIVLCVVQVVASVLVGIWTVRRTTSRADVRMPTERPTPISSGSLVRGWFKSSWLFVVFFFYAIYELWSLAGSQDEISKSFVFRTVWYSAYAGLNAIAGVGFFVLAFQLDLTLRLTNIVKQILVVQGKSLEMNEKAIAVTGEVLSTKRPRRRR